MDRKKAPFVLTCVLALSLFAGGCGSGAAPTSSAGQVEKVATAEVTEASMRAASATGAAAATTVEVTAPQEKISPTQATVWDSSAATQITLNGNSIVVDGDGATVEGSAVTITRAGAYKLGGSLSDGQVIVDTQDKGDVKLVLNGVKISSLTSAPIYFKDADEAFIVLADGTENTVSDGAAYVLEDPASDEPNAAIFSKADLTIAGSGSLTVDGNYNDGIASKDDLTIAGGTLIVSAADDGIRGKDSIIVTGGDITVQAQAMG